MTMDSTNRGWLVLLIVVLVAVSLGPVLGWGMMSGIGWSGIGPMGRGMMGAWGTAAGPWWSLAWLVFWALIAGAVVLLVFWGLRQASPAGGGLSRSPLDVLMERYARGELTREQYEQMRRDLEEAKRAAVSR
jgi:putative membrane protein